MADAGLDDAEFLVEDVETIVKSALQSVLNDTSYEQEKLNAWSNAVIDNCLKGLAGLGKPFKYVCSVILMQKTGAPLHTAAGAFWDKKKDGIVSFSLGCLARAALSLTAGPLAPTRARATPASFGGFARARPPPTKPRSAAPRQARPPTRTHAHLPPSRNSPFAVQGAVGERDHARNRDGLRTLDDAVQAGECRLGIADGRRA